MDGVALRPNLTIAATTVHSTARLVLRGELDCSSAPELRQRIRQAMAAGTTIVELDLADVSFIDAAGVGVLRWPVLWRCAGTCSRERVEPTCAKRWPSPTPRNAAAAPSHLKVTTPQTSSRPTRNPEREGRHVRYPELVERAARLDLDGIVLCGSLPSTT